MLRSLLRHSALSLFIVTVSGLGPSGCGGGAAVTVGPREEGRYRNPEYPYEVQPAPESPTAFLSPEWKAESLRLATGTFNGKPVKTTTIEQHYDWNEDGQPDASEPLAKYELRLVHDSGAVVFIRAVPVPPSLEGRGVGELAHAYLDAVTREGDMAARFSPADLPTPSNARFEVAVLDEGGCRVSGIEAHRVEVLAKRTQPTPGPERRARLVLVRPGYRHRVADAGEVHEVPVMLVAAYTHTAADFEALEGDFSRFLGQWVLGGYGEAIPTERAGHTCQP